VPSLQIVKDTIAISLAYAMKPQTQ